jgi:hypothetical protein
MSAVQKATEKKSPKTWKILLIIAGVIGALFTFFIVGIIALVMFVPTDGGDASRSESRVDIPGMNASIDVPEGWVTEERTIDGLEYFVVSNPRDDAESVGVYILDYGELYPDLTDEEYVELDIRASEDYIYDYQVNEVFEQYNDENGNYELLSISDGDEEFYYVNVAIHDGDGLYYNCEIVSEAWMFDSDAKKSFEVCNTLQLESPIAE